MRIMDNKRVALFKRSNIKDDENRKPLEIKSFRFMLYDVTLIVPPVGFSTSHKNASRSKSFD